MFDYLLLKNIIPVRFFVSVVTIRMCKSHKLWPLSSTLQLQSEGIERFEMGGGVKFD